MAHSRELLGPRREMGACGPHPRAPCRPCRPCPAAPPAPPAAEDRLSGNLPYQRPARPRARPAGPCLPPALFFHCFHSSPPAPPRPAPFSTISPRPVCTPAPPRPLPALPPCPPYFSFLFGIYFIQVPRARPSRAGSSRAGPSLAGPSRAGPRCGRPRHVVPGFNAVVLVAAITSLPYISANKQQARSAAARPAYQGATGRPRHAPPRTPTAAHGSRPGPSWLTGTALSARRCQTTSVLFAMAASMCLLSATKSGLLRVAARCYLRLCAMRYVGV